MKLLNGIITVGVEKTGSKETFFALVLLFSMALVVGSALGFEHIGGYIPCALCLEQRQPFYWGMPLAIIAAVLPLISSGKVQTAKNISKILLLLIGALMAYNAGLGIYHSGVEWQWWQGPTSCATSTDLMSATKGDLLSSLETTKPPSCGDAALRVLGLSFAGWNVLASSTLAIFAFLSVKKLEE